VVLRWKRWVEAVQDAMRSCDQFFAPCQLFMVGSVIVFGLPQQRVDQIISDYQRNAAPSPEPTR
jgi:hypothetical protein